jgi:hypothetical protein
MPADRCAYFRRHRGFAAAALCGGYPRDARRFPVRDLLDVNVLVAWGWADQVDHQRAIRWIARQKKARGAALFTSPIPEIGFVRFSVHRASGRLTVRQAADVLRGMLASLGPVHRFLPDDVNGLEWPRMVRFRRTHDGCAVSRTLSLAADSASRGDFNQVFSSGSLSGKRWCISGKPRAKATEVTSARGQARGRAA